MGLLVTSVADDSPAARAGLLVGDVIVTLGGEAAGSLEVCASVCRWARRSTSASHAAAARTRCSCK